MFDLAVFLWLPPDLRMHRLREREVERFGPEIGDSSHPMHRTHKEFLEWASGYDTGGIDMRSKARHEEWMADLPCPVVRIEGDRTVQERMKAVLGRQCS